MATDAVRTEHVSHAYRRFPWSRGRESLRDVSFAARRGELHVLAGANGAGKSTLLRILVGLLRPASGLVEVLGLPPHARELRARVAWLPESAHTPSRIRVRDLVGFAAALAGARRDERRRRVHDALEMAGLLAHADRRFHALSKGERRRVALAQTLVQDAELLVLDEPFDGVDPESCELIAQRLRDLARTGRAVLLSSHVLLDGGGGGDVLTVLDAGRVVAHGPPASLLRDDDGSPIGFARLLRRSRGGA